MEERVLDQEKVAKACICAAKATIEYSNAGPADMVVIAKILGDAMEIMREKLTPANQEKFDSWCTKKSNEIRESWNKI